VSSFGDKGDAFDPLTTLLEHRSSVDFPWDRELATNAEFVGVHFEDLFFSFDSQVEQIRRWIVGNPFEVRIPEVSVFNERAIRFDFTQVSCVFNNKQRASVCVEDDARGFIEIDFVDVPYQLVREQQIRAISVSGGW